MLGRRGQGQNSLARLTAAASFCSQPMAPSLNPNAMHAETGGLRWGRSFWAGWNVTCPLAQLQATEEQITIRLRGIGPLCRRFVFDAGDPLSLHFRPGILPCATGLVIGHRNPGYPPFILFWTFHPAALRAALIRLGDPLDEPQNEP